MKNSFESLHGQVIAVTGASGYIGSSLVDALLRNSCDVILISRNEIVQRKNVRVKKVDIREFEAWIEIVEKSDLIYHLGGNTSVYEASKNPAASLISTLLPINHLIMAARALKRKPRVIYASTATVYGMTLPVPIAETVEPKPITVYDQHKIFSEWQLSLAAKEGLLDFISLRLSNVYGPSISRSTSEDRGVLNKVAMMATQKKDIIIYGDGNYLRDYIFIEDVIDAFVMAGATKNVTNEVFNISTGNSVSVGDAFRMIANRVLEITGEEVNVKHSPWFNGAAEIEYRSYISDPKKALDLLGWSSKVSLENGIDKMLQKLMPN
jgi:UDP-glucose 4-epimerase